MKKSQHRMARKRRPAQRKAAIPPPPTKAESAKRRHAAKFLCPELMPAVTIAMRVFEAQDAENAIDPAALTFELDKVLQSVSEGDMRPAEKRAMAQAILLDLLFQKLTQTAFLNLRSPAFDGFMRLALRAQAQSARTLETIAALKNPAIFAKQVNIGQRQIVANGAMVPLAAEGAQPALSESPQQFGCRGAKIVRLAQTENLTRASDVVE